MENLAKRLQGDIDEALADVNEQQKRVRLEREELENEKARMLQVDKVNPNDIIGIKGVQHSFVIVASFW